MSTEKLLPVGFLVDENIAQEILAQLEDGMLSCARAHAVAKHFNVQPSHIGHTVDALEIRLKRCQLGLFGYPNKKGWEDAGIKDLPIPDEFEQALSAKASVLGSLSCETLWQLAAAYKLPRMQVGYIANKLNIRIVSCQLGAF